MSTKLKWERVSLGHYRAIDERGREWKLYRDYSGWVIRCNGFYQADVDRAFGALADAKRLASELAQNETVRM